MDSGKDPGIEIITRRQQSKKGVQDMKTATEAANKADPIAIAAIKMAEENGLTLYEMMMIPELIESRIKYSLRGGRIALYNEKTPDKAGGNL